MYGEHSVSIVLPAYNEEHNIRRAVDDFFETGVVDEVVVVDNNSRDRTAEETRLTRARLVTETKQGYGHALRRGLAGHQPGQAEHQGACKRAGGGGMGVHGRLLAVAAARRLGEDGL